MAPTPQSRPWPLIVAVCVAVILVASACAAYFLLFGPPRTPQAAVAGFINGSGESNDLQVWSVGDRALASALDEKMWAGMRVGRPANPQDLDATPPSVVEAAVSGVDGKPGVWRVRVAAGFGASDVEVLVARRGLGWAVRDVVSVTPAK